MLDCVWNVMTHAQKPDFVFRRNGRDHLIRRGCQFSRLLAAEVCASAVVMLDTPCSEVVWRVLSTHSIRQFPIHFPSRASPCAVTFKLDSATQLCHTKVTVSIPTDRTTQQQPSASVSPTISIVVPYISTSHHLAIPFTRRLVTIGLASDERFGLIRVRPNGIGGKYKK